MLSHTLTRNIHTKSFWKLFKALYLLSEFIELNLNLICHFHNKNKDIPIKEVLFNTTINQRHFHDPFYSIIIDQNIIFGQNLVKKTKNTNLFLKMNLWWLPLNKHFAYSLSFFTLLKMPIAGIEPVTFALRMRCSTNWAKSAIPLIV